MNRSALAAGIHNVLQCVAVCCSVLQCVAVCCTEQQMLPSPKIALICVAACCSVLQCVTVCRSVAHHCCPARTELSVKREKEALYTTRKGPLSSHACEFSVNEGLFETLVSTQTLLRTLRVCTNFTQKFRIKAHSGSRRAANQNLDNSSLH